MRLLSRTENEELVLQEFDDNALPPYAILSHTWRRDEEVSYDDLLSGSGSTKAGYTKIRFCGERAAKDQLQYFWVDTCCIDKRNSTELGAAINSMFTWYRRATRCYVYLADVSVPDEVLDLDSYRITWEEAFRDSLWFSRGWTLQELLAPGSVEFFSSEGRRLGDKRSLEQEVHEITQIRIEALRQFDLRSFSMYERMSWIQGRITTIPEDRAYCLLGIFGVFLPMIYGEGVNHALRRLREEIAKREKELRSDEDSNNESTFAENRAACLASLSFPALDGRLNDIAFAHSHTCDWLFRSAEFCKWRDQLEKAEHNGVLWIKGKPGAGKSTLMKHALSYCTDHFVDQLVASHFFNLRGEDMEKNALGMIRSLVYQLARRDTAICNNIVIRYREKQLTTEGGRVEWRTSDLLNFLVSEISRGQKRPILLLVDALDECNDADVREVVAMLEMLSKKAMQFKATLRICLSSRHYPTIDMNRRLELNVDHSDAHREDIMRYVADMLETDDLEIRSEIESKANGIFLWAVLVVALLNDSYRAGRLEDMHGTLLDLPGDLEDVFEAILARDESHRNETKSVLQWVLFSPRPMMPEELYFAIIFRAPGQQDPKAFPTVNAGAIQRRLVDSSKGLVEVRPGDQNMVQFIHRSVNDFLLQQQRLQRLDRELGEDPVQTSHRALWSCCRDYIQLLDRTRVSAGYISNARATYVFMDYAMAFVFYFANKALSTNDIPDIKGKDMWPFSSLTNLIWSPNQDYVAISEWLQDWNRAPQSSECWRRFLTTSPTSNTDVRVEEGAGLLYTLCINDYHQLVRVLLAGGDVDVNTAGGEYGNALQAAVVGGLREMVQLLLAKGADVNLEGGKYGNALQAAAFAESAEIAKILLDHGANMEAQGGPYGSALQAAAASPHDWQIRVLQLLLEWGAEVNAAGGHYGNPLKAAVLCKDQESVDLLMQYGAIDAARTTDTMLPAQTVVVDRLG